jgi:hypothetical protein
MALQTSFDAIDAVYLRLAYSPLKTAISGGIYKMVRPIDAGDDRKEDIVVNSLGMPNADVQHGIVNVNIHVPNLQLPINGRQDNTQPDFARLQQLADLVIGQVKEFYSQAYYFLFQQQNMLQGEEGEHLINIRLDYYSINL